METIQPWWLSGKSSSFAIFKDGNPAWTQARIPCRTMILTACDKNTIQIAGYQVAWEVAYGIEQIDAIVPKNQY